MQFITNFISKFMIKTKRLTCPVSYIIEKSNTGVRVKERDEFGFKVMKKFGSIKWFNKKLYYKYYLLNSIDILADIVTQYELIVPNEWLYKNHKKKKFGNKNEQNDEIENDLKRQHHKLQSDAAFCC